MSRKRPRAAEISPRQPPASKLAFSSTLKLLSLPDEVLSFILFQLGASNTCGSFQGPRHAFALAQTNTRLLRLFGNLLSHITPDTENPTPPTLSRLHFLSVTRLAGHALRELHLPDGCFEILPSVAQACPGIEALSVVDNPLCPKTYLLEALGLLSLRSLGITDPSFQCLGLLCFLESLPPDLTLTHVNKLYVLELIPVLRNPPSKLSLSVDYKGFNVPPWLTKLLASFAEAIPKMESLALEMPFCFWHDRLDFADEAARLIAASRRNGAESKCMSIKLAGHGIFRLLNYVNPKAKIEISCSGQTFADYGDGFHARQLVIGRRFSMTDVSRLKHVIVLETCNRRWKTALSGVKLECAEVYDQSAITDLGLAVDKIEMNHAHCRGSQWGWVTSSHELREVRIVGQVRNVAISSWCCFFEALGSLLDQFHGEVVWIGDINMNEFTPRLPEILSFLRTVRSARAAAERFEERGGDAGTIKSLVDRILKLAVVDV